MTSVKPSLALLREISDEAVLRALMDGPPMTRAELAVATGLSKPTAGDAIRRLESAGLVCDTGERTTGRGGVGTYYALAENVGRAAAVSIAPGGVTVETLDSAGTLIARVAEPVPTPATAQAVAAALAGAAGAAIGRTRVRIAAVSAADPVDKTTGELVHLPDAPFVIGAMSPTASLAPLMDGPVLVDNDVNWAARAERAARAAADPGTPVDDFLYLYLGEGLGCAVVADGHVLRGHRGLAGEIAHVCVPGPDGAAMLLTAVFGHLGLRRRGSTAIDVDQLLAILAAPGGETLARALALAIGGVLEAAVAFTDPSFVVLGGPWSWASSFAAALAAVVGDSLGGLPVVPPQVHDNPPLAGARAAAVEGLRADIIRRSKAG